MLLEGAMQSRICILWVISLAAILVVWARPLSADIILLQNGGEVRGEFLSEDADVWPEKKIKPGVHILLTAQHRM